jgi:hypothetical protein
LGPIELEALEVPSFSKNLLSATQLSIEHGCKQVIEPWTSKLTISKDDEIIATGTYDKASKLIIIDEVDSSALAADNVVSIDPMANNIAVSEIPSRVSKVAQVKLPQKQPTSKKSTADDWLTVHRKMGHVGSSMMSKTLKATTGLSLANKFSVLSCKDCKVAKAKRNAIPRGKAQNDHSVLDVVEIDVQGPFPVVANDGTNSNVKMIDSKSNFLYFTTVPDTKAATMLDSFLIFKARIEKQTGLQIKRVRADQGVELMGEFLAYLDLSGIVKEKGVAYTHHHPGKAERAHQTILRNARAMLKDSMLPPKYYDEAQRTAVYIFNRTVHGKDTITPYQHIFKKEPDLKHLRPFGSVCYAFIPPEKRSKLSDSGIRCRLLGYGDDFGVEEIRGYKLLNEIDGTIFWSDSVIFDKDSPMERLDNIFYSHDDDKISDELWTPFINQEETEQDRLDDIFFDAEDSISDSELSNLVVALEKQKWWQADKENPKKQKGLKTDEENPIFKLHTALQAIVHGIPTSYKEAMNSDEASQWKAAMCVEMDNLKANDTFRLYKPKMGEKAIGCRWVFRKKLKLDGTLDKYKARLVAKGYLQKLGRDFNETYAPVAKFKSIRLLLAIAAHRNQKVYQDDAVSAFLNGILKERVLMDQPEGYEVNSDDYKWLLQKTLYGLKQSPREWNEVFHLFMVENDFVQCENDPCFYFKSEEKSLILVGLYVDDVITTGSDESKVTEFRTALKKRFKCSEGGLLNWALGMEIIQESGIISLNQNQYINQKLIEFDSFLEKDTKRSIPLDPNFQKLLIEADESQEFEPKFPYRQIVGSLMYAAIGTRFDISTAVGIASRFLESPKQIHCEMVRQILYYLRQNPTSPLSFKRVKDPKLVIYCDSSFANTEDYASISGFAVLFGGSLLSWSSKKQPVIALSSTEAEYVAATGASQEALWFKSMLSEIGIDQPTVTIHEDNESCIKLANNPQEFKRTRHIQVKYHFIRSLVREGKIKLEFCPTKDQLADIFTKGVNGPRLKEISSRLGQSNQHGRELNNAGYVFDAWS